MKALSVLEPWATLIIHHGKSVENRTWPTTYRGPLVICASKKIESGWNQEEWDYFYTYFLESLKSTRKEAAKIFADGYRNGLYSHEYLQECLDGLTDDRIEKKIPFPRSFKALNLKPGYALGTVDVIGCYRQMTGDLWEHPDQYHFRLVNARPFVTPFPIKGQLGFYDIDDDLIARGFE